MLEVNKEFWKNYSFQALFFFNSKPILFIYSFVFSRASPAAYGGSQARGLHWAVSAAQTTAQGNAISPTTERGQGSNLQPHGS